MPGPAMHLLPVSPSNQSQPQRFHPASDPLHLRDVRATHHHASSRVGQPRLNRVDHRM